MNELSKLTRQHYEKNEAGASLVSKVTKILDSLPAGSVDSSQLAGLDQFHRFLYFRHFLPAFGTISYQSL